MILEPTFDCNKFSREESPFKDLVTENMICVGLREQGYNSLVPFEFDSPGATLVFNGTVYGIFSWQRTTSGSLKVFTRVSAFSEWIKNW